jgi:hypothetical protein
MTLREEVLAHYDRMIAWAEKQEQRSDMFLSCILMEKMREEIGETPQGGECPLCQRFNTCGNGCLVFKKTNQWSCRGTPWRKILEAETIDDFVTALKAEREFLAGLDYGEEE